MAGRRSFVIVSAWAAALLSNYWLLEGVFADRTELVGSWISDLSTRSEGSGAIFLALGVASGLAIVLYALALLGPLGGRGVWVRRGVVALAVSGAFVVVASAAPLSCAEGLEARCHLDDDGLDLLHDLATVGEIAATALAFGLIGWGLLEPPSRLSPSGLQTTNALPGIGVATLVLGAIWAVLAIVTGVSYLSDAVDEVKGVFQRGDQVVFGVWLLVLARGALSAPFLGDDGSGGGGG
jgi:hypothetical protein